MKNECDIVKDLLFSYNDGVLSETSKELVEEHLKTCESCSNVLKEIKQESKQINQKEDIDAFKGVRRKITKKNVIIAVSLIFLLIIIIFNIFVFKNYNEVTSTMEIILQKDVTEEQLENIINVITKSDSDVEIKYISKQDALDEVKEWLGNESNLLDVYDNSENNPFLDAIEIKTNNNKKIESIVEEIQDMPGINKINTYINWNPYELFVSQYLIVNCEL